MLSKTDTPIDAHARRGTLRVIATTDLHGALMPHDYFTDTPTPGVGLLALSNQIAQLRDTTATTILVDNGDFLQGTPMTDAVVAAHSWQDMHPMVEAMNAAKYDAVTLGNHEFNFGLGLLNQTIDDVDATVVSANIFQRDTGEAFVDPYVILKRDIVLDDETVATLNIGVLGLAPPQITTWDARVVGDKIKTIDILKAAIDQIPRMKQAGADFVLVLAHTGIGAEEDSEFQENVAIPLAAIDGIDALVLGHTHETFPRCGEHPSPFVDAPSATLHGKPAIMPPALGQGLGHIDLDLEWLDEKWTVAGFTARLFRAEQIEPPAEVTAPPLAALAHAKTLSLIRTPIGQTTKALQSYFSCVSNCPMVQLVNDAQRALVATELEGTKWANLSLLSVASPFISGGHGGVENYIDIAPGPLAICNGAEIYPYPNTVCAAVLSGAEITLWLERAASVFRALEEHRGAQDLLDANFPSYDFDVFDGLTYEIDLTQPAMFHPDGRIANPTTQRIKTLCLDGVAVGPDAEFVVATNNYRVGGGGGFFEADPSRVILDTKRAARDVLIDHIKASSPINQVAKPTWSFAKISGAIGVFDTSPAAPAFAAGVADRRFLGFADGPDGETLGRLEMG